KQEEPEDDDFLSLKVGLVFQTWEEFRYWIYRFVSKEGFDYKIRTSEFDNIDIIIDSFKNEHNHILTPMINEIAFRFRKLILEMLANIKKYMIQGRLNSASIYLLIKYDYALYPLNKQDLYNAIYDVYRNNNLGDSDASLILQILL
ncbi:27147_t:CDS:2, partial [Racocetra persica]